MVRGGGLILGMVAAALGLGAGPSAAAAATFTVTGTGDPAGASCTGSTCTSLRAAVAAADQVKNVGSTISLGAATYSLGGNGAVGGPLSITLDTTIAGAGHAATTIRQLGTSDGVIQITAPTASVRLSGLTITGGHAIGAAGTSVSSGPGDGGDGGDAAGGVLDLGSLTLDDVAVTHNSAQGGLGGGTHTGHAGVGGTAAGGILVGGSLALTNSTVSGNVAAGGIGGPSDNTSGGNGGTAIGGVAAQPGAGPVQVVGSDLSSNQASGGAGGVSAEGPFMGAHFGAGGRADGGLALLGSAPASVSRSVLDENAATGGLGGSQPGNNTTGGAGGSAEGGGIYAAGGPVSVTDTELDGDAANGGAGGASPGGSGTGGSALGGGLAVEGSASLVLHRATIALNTATAGDGGSTPVPSAPPVSTGASGADAQGAGAFITGPSALVDATIAKNTAAGSAGAAATAAVLKGPDGRGIGGGISVQGGTLKMMSDTFADNAALAPPGAQTYGGDFDDGGVPVTVATTIFAGGTAMAPGATCSIFGVPQFTDAGHNLEYPDASSCQLTLASDVHQNPQLGQLTANGGGAGPMLVLAAASPARGAGGICTDPSLAGSPPLGVDERGQPRHSPCDIGAYETQPPSVARAPALASPAVVGRATSCATGGFNGDQPLAFVFSWLRDGHAIPGTSAAQYTPVSTDVAHHIACSLTASNQYGTASATSNAVPVVKPTLPKLAGASLTSSKLTDDGKGHVLATIACPLSTPGGSCRVAIGLYSTTGKLPASVSRVRRRARAATRLAGGHVTIRAGKRAVVKLGLTAAGRRATKRLPLRVRAVITTRAAFGASVTHTLTASVVLPKRPKRHR